MWNPWFWVLRVAAGYCIHCLVDAGAWCLFILRGCRSRAGARVQLGELVCCILHKTEKGIIHRPESGYKWHLES